MLLVGGRNRSRSKGSQGNRLIKEAGAMAEESKPDYTQGQRAAVVRSSQVSTIDAGARMVKQAELSMRMQIRVVRWSWVKVRSATGARRTLHKDWFTLAGCTVQV